MKTKSTFKSLLSLLLILLMVFSLAGCKTNASAKDEGYEKFSKLEIGMTEEEVKAILGEPARVDKAYYYYNIKVNGNDMELTVWIDQTTGEVSNMYGDFMSADYRDAFIDKKTDLSEVKGLDSGDIDTYDACKETFKTPGYLVGIDEDGREKYLWVNSKGGYLTVSFDSDGNVRTYNGYC